MPTLNHLNCTVDVGPTDDALEEFKVTYNDGFVQAYVNVPDEPAKFSIRLTSSGYVAPGLGMFVYIDGAYQCNRNHKDLVMDKKLIDCYNIPTLVDIRVRQAESMMIGEIVGREWRFDTFKDDDYGQPDLPEEVTNSIGSIEVVILRCYDPIPGIGSNGKVAQLSNSRMQLLNPWNYLSGQVPPAATDLAYDKPYFGGLDGFVDDDGDASRQPSRSSRRVSFGDERDQGYRVYESHGAHQRRRNDSPSTLSELGSPSSFSHPSDIRPAWRRKHGIEHPTGNLGFEQINNAPGTRTQEWLMSLPSRSVEYNRSPVIGGRDGSDDCDDYRPQRAHISSGRNREDIPDYYEWPSRRGHDEQARWHSDHITGPGDPSHGMWHRQFPGYPVVGNQFSQSYHPQYYMQRNGDIPPSASMHHRFGLMAPDAPAYGPDLRGNHSRKAWPQDHVNNGVYPQHIFQSQPPPWGGVYHQQTSQYEDMKQAGRWDRQGNGIQHAPGYSGLAHSKAQPFRQSQNSSRQQRPRESRSKEDHRSYDNDENSGPSHGKSSIKPSVRSHRTGRTGKASSRVKEGHRRKKHQSHSRRSSVSTSSTSSRSTATRPRRSRASARAPSLPPQPLDIPGHWDDVYEDKETPHHGSDSNGDRSSRRSRASRSRSTRHRSNGSHPASAAGKAAWETSWNADADADADIEGGAGDADIASHDQQAWPATEDHETAANQDNYDGGAWEGQASGGAAWQPSVQQLSRVEESESRKKQYWASWKAEAFADPRTGGRMRNKRSPGGAGGGRTSALDELPSHLVPEEVVRAKGLQYRVRTGPGVLYNMDHFSPNYIDTMENPYAVFRFYYRSKDYVQNMLDGRVELDAQQWTGHDAEDNGPPDDQNHGWEKAPSVKSKVTSKPDDHQSKPDNHKNTPSPRSRTSRARSIQREDPFEAVEATNEGPDEEPGLWD